MQEEEEQHQNESPAEAGPAPASMNLPPPRAVTGPSGASPVPSWSGHQYAHKKMKKAASHSKDRESSSSYLESSVDQESVHADRVRTVKNFAFRSCTVPIIVLLFMAAIIMIFLYVTEIENLKNKGRAAKRIQTYIGCYNESFRMKNETERFEQAKHLVEWMRQLKTKNEKLLYSINDLKKKMEEGWAKYGGNFYFFSNKTDIYEVAQKDCENRHSLMLDITSPEEEDFAEASIPHDAATWLGLQLKNGVWMWPTGEKLQTAYWSDSVSPSDGDCVYILKCSVSRKCWFRTGCTSLRHWICRLRPDPRWV